MTCPQCEKLREALVDMCCQFCSINGRLQHMCMSAEEDAFDLLGIDNGMTTEEAWRKVAAAPSPLTTTITWIPVSERLPEDDRDVFVVAGRAGPAVAGYYDAEDGEWLNPETNRRLGGVTHWAESPMLPPPPASAEGEG